MGGQGVSRFQWSPYYCIVSFGLAECMELQRQYLQTEGKQSQNSEADQEIGKAGVETHTAMKVTEYDDGQDITKEPKDTDNRHSYTFYQE